jgi:hypothetical protein
MPMCQTVMLSLGSTRVKELRLRCVLFSFSSGTRGLGLDLATKRQTDFFVAPGRMHAGRV